MNTGKSLLGLIVGLSVGAVVGVLLAPYKGKKTRNKIAKNSHNMLHSINTKFDEFVDGFAQKVEDVKKDYNDTSTRVKNRLDHLEV
ncbi:MAG TPA: YtxH domain-containing protein [Saprospiraceae bacterium]|nr:YtxH domain-containing protein [Saprospiraceae bacterium]